MFFVAVITAEIFIPVIYNIGISSTYEVSEIALVYTIIYIRRYIPA